MMCLATCKSIHFVATVKLNPFADAQLTSPGAAVCVGRQVEFICQHLGLPRTMRWTVTLPGVVLRAYSPMNIGMTQSFENDPGYGFELEVLSSTPNSNQELVSRCELRVTAKKQLDGVAVECEGFSGIFTSTIQVAFVGKLLH